MFRMTSVFWAIKQTRTLRHVALLAASALVLATPASASAQRYSATLSGAAEVPPNASPATGFAFFELYEVANEQMLSVDVTFAGLMGLSTAAHIHCCTSDLGGTVGVATTTPTFFGFPGGVTSGDYFAVLNLHLAGSYRAGFITENGGTVDGARSALVAGLNAGTTYFNLHSVAFPGGEIRGFITEVPEPTTYALLGVGLVLLFASGARRRHHER